jgi:predicted ATP-binding protein involved in virulence
MRVSTLPVAFGEKVVIRIFDPEVLMQDLGDLGFFPREHKLFNTFIEKPHGIILVTGPTGSGKTTTLYSALKVLATPDVNITTIEDPIEMAWEEFNQVGVQPKADLTFASTLRAILRQDPDIIMVGEIRDKERIITSEVRNAFARALASRRKVDLKKESVRLKEELLEFTRIKLRAGDVSSLEVNVAELEYGKTKLAKSDNLNTILSHHLLVGLEIKDG